MASDEIVPNDGDANTGRADVLLCTSIHNSVFAPVDLLGQEVTRHVANEVLALGHEVEWEVLIKLDTLDRLIVTVVEELSVGVDVPLRRISDRPVADTLVVGDFVGVAILASLSDRTL